MTKSSSSYVAAAIAFAFAGASLANDTASPTSGSGAASQPPALNAAAQCEALVGDKKDQCMRQVQQNRGAAGAATGATSGSGASGGSVSAPRNPGASGGDSAGSSPRQY